MDIFDRPARRRGEVLAVVVAVALILGAVAAERWAGRKDGAVEAAGLMRLAAPTPAGLRSPSPAPEAVTEFDKLLDLFREAKTVPAAASVVQAFAKEFKETPELEQAFEEFERDQNGPEPQGTLTGFARGLADRAEFQQLVSRFAQDPGFRAVALQLSARPEIREAIRDVLAKAKADGRDPRRRAQLSSRFRSRQLGAAGGKSAQPAGEALEPGRPPHSPVPLGSPARSPKASETSASTDKKDGRAGEDASQAHNVDPRLAAIAAAGRDTGDIRQFCRQPEYAGFCAGNPPALKPEFKVIESLIPKYGLWGACFRQKIYAKCADACTGNCRPVEPWEACLEAYSSETVCVGACPQQEPPCYVPGRIWAKHCEPLASSCTKAAESLARSRVLPQCGPDSAVRFPEPCSCSPSSCPSACGDTLTCSCTGAGCPPTAAAPKKTGPLRRSAWLGYNLGPDDKLVVGPDQAKTIQLMYSLFIKTNGNAEQVAKKLNDWNRNKKDGKGRVVEDFTGPKVNAMVQRCAYAGAWGERLRIVGDQTFTQALSKLKGDGVNASALGCAKPGGGSGQAKAN